MQKNELGASLPKITADDFFTTQEERDSFNLPKVKVIPIRDLYDFPNHPFKVRDDEEMQRLIESVSLSGIIEPALVRPRENGGYEMLSGHRRKKASQLAGLKEMLCLVKNYNDDEATIVMVDSNNHRESLLPSEKAFAYKMKMEAIKHQGRRTDLTSSQVATKLENGNSADIVGKENGDSKDTIYRYIRLTELKPEILDMVDDKRIAFTPAVEISYLKKEEQEILLDCMQFMDVTPSLAQAIKLKKLSQSGKLDGDTIDDILSEKKPNQVEKIKINKERLESVLPKNLKSQKDIEEHIIKCMQYYNKQQKQKNMESR
ncbi:MAG: ParB/RepB/Spo0J family partition protein [Clostridia bacterium]|nr:ParB/RepB/Spo0J family partition protein [Clostridia bacterium]MDD4386555.1 ParB/RepB/Spo0J family partition protein [Clostridia bacterium]